MLLFRCPLPMVQTRGFSLKLGNVHSQSPPHDRVEGGVFPCHRTYSSLCNGLFFHSFVNLGDSYPNKRPALPRGIRPLLPAQALLQVLDTERVEIQSQAVRQGLPFILFVSELLRLLLTTPDSSQNLTTSLALCKSTVLPEEDVWPLSHASQHTLSRLSYSYLALWLLVSTPMCLSLIRFLFAWHTLCLQFPLDS